MCLHSVSQGIWEVVIKSLCCQVLSISVIFPCWNFAQLISFPILCLYVKIYDDKSWLEQQKWLLKFPLYCLRAKIFNCPWTRYFNYSVFVVISWVKFNREKQWFSNQIIDTGITYTHGWSLNLLNIFCAYYFITYYKH